MASLLNMSGRGLVDHDFTPPYIKGYTLIHHWEADDWTVGTDWVDRIGGLIVTKHGSPTKENGYVKVNYNNYFDRSPVCIYMGNIWEIEIDFIVNQDTKVNFIADFGSLAQSSHAFSFTVYPDGHVFFNAKLSGNNNAYTIGSYYITFGVPQKLILGTEYDTETTRKLFAIINNEKVYFDRVVPIADATFNNNFDKNIIFFGRGYFPYNPSFDTQSKADAYIKSIKIYKLTN